jgi:hypothetical protein
MQVRDPLFTCMIGMKKDIKYLEKRMVRKQGGDKLADLYLI